MARKRKYPKGESPWIRMFARISEYEPEKATKCSLCNKLLVKGTAIFYFPDIKIIGDEGTGRTYCFDCCTRQLLALTIAGEL